MAISKTDAVIIHSRKQGETSKILTVYSEQFGKMRLVAKGSRGVKSKYLGILETLNHVTLIFYRKENRDIQYLSQADVVDRFPSIHEQLGKLALAAIPCEIIDRAETTEHQNQPLFHLLLDTLHALEQAKTGLKNIIRSFYLYYIKISGFEPEISSCAHCGTDTFDKNYFFELQNGNIACEDCALVTENSVRLSGKALETLQWLNRVDMSQVYDKTLPAQIGVELDDLLVPYLRFHIEGILNLRSLDHLHQLQSHLEK